jgi:hypothetical protein
MAVATINFFYLPSLIFSMLLLLPSACGIAPGTLKNGGNITDGELVVSASGSFTLGFFSLTGESTKKYLGVWFTASPDTICWVANHDTLFALKSGTVRDM